MYLTMPKMRGFLSGGLGQAKPPKLPVGPELSPPPPFVPWYVRTPPKASKLPPPPPLLEWWTKLGAKGEKRELTSAEIQAQAMAWELETKGPAWMQDSFYYTPEGKKVDTPRGWQPFDDPQEHPGVTAVRLLPGGAMELRLQSGAVQLDLSNFRSTPEMPRFDLKAYKDAIKKEKERIKHEKEAAKVLKLPPWRPLPGPLPVAPKVMPVEVPETIPVRSKSSVMYTPPREKPLMYKNYLPVRAGKIYTISPYSKKNTPGKSYQIGVGWFMAARKAVTTMTAAARKQLNIIRAAKEAAPVSVYAPPMQITYARS